MKVGVAQIPSFSNDNLAESIELHLDYIRQAKESKIELLVFPELSTAGHHGYDAVFSLSLFQDSPEVSRLAEASQEMTTVFGLIEKTYEGLFYNASYAVRNGKILGIHRKINLATYGKLEDGKHFAKGTSLHPFQLNATWKTGILICNDTWDPSLPYLYMLHGINLLIVPFSSALEAVGATFDNKKAWDVNLRFYSQTYGLPVVAANHVSSSKKLSFWGGSRIMDAFGNILAVAEDKPVLLSAEIHFDDVLSGRYTLPVLRDLDPYFTHAEMGNILFNQKNTHLKYYE